MILSVLYQVAIYFSHGFKVLHKRMPVCVCRELKLAECRFLTRSYVTNKGVSILNAGLVIIPVPYVAALES